MRFPSLLFRQLGLFVTHGPGYCKHRTEADLPPQSAAVVTCAGRRQRAPLELPARTALNCDTQSAMRPFQVERHRPLHAAALKSIQEVRASHGTPEVPSPRVGVGAARRWP